jgi:hypothetical protein
VEMADGMERVSVALCRRMLPRKKIGEGYAEQHCGSVVPKDDESRIRASTFLASGYRSGPAEPDRDSRPDLVGTELLATAFIAMILGSLFLNSGIVRPASAKTYVGSQIVYRTPPTCTTSPPVSVLNFTAVAMWPG